MEDVAVSDTPPSSPFSEVRLICGVCQKQFSQYTCPKCNTRYCSLQCYKRHSLRCTESFMRENVMGELQHLRPEDETKRKMLEILKRFHSEEETNSDDEDASVLSEETIQKVLSAGEAETSRKGKSGRKLKGVERKVYFLTCWAHEQPAEASSSLAGLVEMEKASIMASKHGRKKPGMADVNDRSRTKVLIEEV